MNNQEDPMELLKQLTIWLKNNRQYLGEGLIEAGGGVGGALLGDKLSGGNIGASTGGALLGSMAARLATRAMEKPPVQPKPLV